jgi:putative (di)nucleoside polyphosphate hydrolase
VGPDSVIDINTKKPEFQGWKWIQPAEFKLTWLPEFKRAVYQAVMKDFFSVDA